MMNSRIGPRTYREWVVLVMTAVAVMVAVLLPVYVIYAINEDSEKVLQQLAEDRELAFERAIRVNVSTISCMLLIAPEERTAENLETCIREGLQGFDNPEEP